MKKIRLLLLLLIGILVISFTGNKKKWVAIGDSITYLNDHPEETGNRITKGYMTMVTEALPDIEYVNQGHNGWTAVRIATEIEKLGVEPADIYSVFLGTNDWWSGRPLGTMADYTNGTGNASFYGAMRTILDKLRSLQPSAKIILITPMQRVDFVYIGNYKNNAYGSYKAKNGQWLAQFAAAVDSIGKYEKVAVVDLYNKSRMRYKNLVRFKYLKDSATQQYKRYTYPDFVGRPFNPEKDEYPYPVEAVDMTYDGLHPSDRGYKVISEKLVKIMRKF